MSFPEKLSAMMAERYETKYALAKAIQVEQSTVANWLNGETTPQYRHLGRLAEHYGCSVEYLREEVNA